MQGDREEEKFIPEGEEIEEEKIVSSSEAQHDDIIKEDEDLNEEFRGESREKSLELSEPGYALVSLLVFSRNTILISINIQNYTKQ